MKTKKMQWSILTSHHLMSLLIWIMSWSCHGSILLYKMCNELATLKCVLSINSTTPNPSKSSKGHFFGKIQHCWKLVDSPPQMGQNYYLARSTGHKVLNTKDQRKCMVHFEDKGMFPKVHWRILEDSGRFLARIPSGLGLNNLYIHVNMAIVIDWVLVAL